MKTQNIDELISRLPQGYEKACYEQKAIQRGREVKNPIDLIRLVFIYLVGGYSLLEVCVIAKQLNIGKLSDTAFMNKFAKCKDWLAWMVSKVIPKPIIDYNLPKKLKLENYILAAVDASDVSEKGRSRQLFRLHYMINLMSLSSLLYKITDRKTGESLVNFDLTNIKQKILIIADRAYGTIKSITHCLDNGADFIVRLRYNAFDLYDEFGCKINLLEKLDKVLTQTAESIDVFVKISKDQKQRLRICAVKIPDENLEQTERKGYRKGKGYKKREKTSAEASQMRKYVVVITSLSSEISSDEIIKLYQLRWQVELYFKRLKSIMDFGNVPLRRTDSIITWLNGKFLVALMIEQMLSEVSFPPTSGIES